MLRQRLISAILLIPTLALAVAIGGWLFFVVALLIFTLAGMEYARLTRGMQAEADNRVLLPGIWLVMLAAAIGDWDLIVAVLAGVAVVALAGYALAYERGLEHASQKWTSTLAGVLYLGLTGVHVIALRAAPDGLYWMMLVIPAAAAADSFAYLVGSRWGRHKMAPRLSPKKSWEGYFGGVILGTGLVVLLAWFWMLGGATTITLTHGLVLGLLVTALSPIGDFGISMFKREAHQKDTGDVLAGMGGVLDRIDSWLVAIFVGYYYLQIFVYS